MSTRAVATLMTPTTRCTTSVLDVTTCSRLRYVHSKGHVRIELGLTIHAQWARTPPSANWRFDAGRPARGDRGDRRERSPRGSRRSVSPAPRRSRYDDEDRRERDYDRRDDRRRDRTRSPDDRDRDMKDRDREDDRDRERPEREYEQNGANGEDRKGINTLVQTLKSHPLILHRPRGATAGARRSRHC